MKGCHPGQAQREPGSMVLADGWIPDNAVAFPG